jgi:hypothetical protein
LTNNDIFELGRKRKKSKEEKNRTAKQSLQDRLVTKIRFCVEKSIGYIKNLKALDNVRNTIIGHIAIDYRIACAMHNFKYKPNRSTILGLNHVERIKNISTLPQINKLEFLKNKNILETRI